MFVYYDDVQYDKHGWRNRNRIKTQNGPLWLTVPVRHGERRVPAHCWTSKSTRGRPGRASTWRASGRRTRARRFSQDYLPALEELLQRKWERLVDLDIACAALMAEWFGLRRRIERSSALGIGGDRERAAGQHLPPLRRVHASLSGDAARGISRCRAVRAPRHRVSNGSGTRIRSTRSSTALSSRYLSALDLLLNCGERGAVDCVRRHALE